MPDQKPVEPELDFVEAAEQSEDAGIADEGGAYTNAIEKDGGEAEAHPS